MTTITPDTIDHASSAARHDVAKTTRKARPVRRLIGLALVAFSLAAASLLATPSAHAAVYDSQFSIYDRYGDARPRFDLRQVTVSDNSKRIYIRVRYRNLWESDGTNTRVTLIIRGAEHNVHVKYGYLYGLSDLDGGYTKWCRSGASRVITVRKPARNFLTISFGKSCIPGSVLRVAQAATARSAWGKPVDAVGNKRKWLRY